MIKFIQVLEKCTTSNIYYNNTYTCILAEKLKRKFCVYKSAYRIRRKQCCIAPVMRYNLLILIKNNENEFSLLKFRIIIFYYRSFKIFQLYCSSLDTVTGIVRKKVVTDKKKIKWETTTICIKRSNWDNRKFKTNLQKTDCLIFDLVFFNKCGVSITIYITWF